MHHPSDLDGPLPDIYRSREAFFASLPAWRRFLAKLNWHPIIDLMVERYAREQEEARRQDRLARLESSPPDDPLLAEFNAELHRRGSATITDLPAEPTDPRPEQANTAPRQPSKRNAAKATLLLLLGIGIAILLFTSPWFWLLLMVATAAYVAFALLASLWQAIYDTLQEGDQPPPP